MANCLMEAFHKRGNLPQDKEEDEKWTCDSCHKTPISPYSWEDQEVFCEDLSQTVESCLHSLCGDLQGHQGAAVEPFLYTYIT